MKGAVDALQEDLNGSHRARQPGTGREVDSGVLRHAHPALQLATIYPPEAMMITIKPFDKTSLKTIEKAILASDLGLTPGNDGTIIRLVFPR